MDEKQVMVACIPAFNEERTVAKVVIEAMKYVGKVIVVDDGSGDMTGEIASRLGAEVIRHDKNLGYGASIKSLFSRARELNADVIITLDADGQHDTNDIPLLAAPVLDNKADIVIGSRFLIKNGNGKTNGVPAYRELGIKAITRLAEAASNSELSDAQSGFRAYSRKALDSLSLFEDGMGLSVEVLMEAKKHDLTVLEVPTRIDYSGSAKTSKSNPLNHGASVIMSIIRLVVEERPLVFLGIPGATSLLIGVLFGVWMLQVYAIEHQITTNVALASMSFVLIGLFALFTSIVLYSINRLMQKANNSKH